MPAVSSPRVRAGRLVLPATLYALAGPAALTTLATLVAIAPAVAAQPSPACVAATQALQQDGPSFAAQVAAIPAPKAPQDLPQYCARAGALMGQLQPQIDRWVAACASDLQLPPQQLGILSNVSRTFTQQCQAAVNASYTAVPPTPRRDANPPPAILLPATPTLPANGLAVIGAPAAQVLTPAARAASGPATAK